MATWIDLVQTDLVIVTGDGKVYMPHFIETTPTKLVEYNTAQFDFKDLPGTLVKRGTPRGTQYDLIITFSGLDHLAVAKAFQDSAANPGAWTITHPYYGSLYVQPISLEFDNRKSNLSEIEGTVIETLLDSGIPIDIDTPGAVTADVATVNNTAAASYASDVPSPGVSDLQALSSHINGAYKAVLSRMNGITADVTTYTNIFNDTIAILNTVGADAINIIGATQNLINAPALFADTVVNRLAQFEAQIALFDMDVANILSLYNTPTASLKRLYENNAGMAIAGMCLAAVSNVTSDYDYRPDILKIIQTLISQYNLFIINLYTIQSANGGEPDSYVPDPGTIIALAGVVDETTSYLFTLANSAKQQRTKVLPYDTNLILVANELYGMQPDDSTITTLIANNNILNSELLVLKQGRKIIYYV